jgi:plasmid stabilization system protein ParE
VILQPRAERDIRTAALWILGRSKSSRTALRWANGIRTKIATLKATPQRCPVDPDSEAYGEEVRVMLYGKRSRVYRVLFAIRGDTVHVLTVRHSAQSGLAEEVAEDASDEGEGRVT